MPRRSTLLAAAAVVLAVLPVAVSGCRPGRPDAAPTVRPARVTAGGDGVGGHPWRGCRDQAESLLLNVPAGVSYDCATIQVPRDWSATAGGATLDLALLRVHRADQTHRLGALVVNPGGPGESGVDLAVYLSTELPAEILRRFDILGFDPRGVGRSSPVKCFRDADEDASFAADPDPVSQAAFDAEVALARSMAQGCAAKYGDSLRLYSTEQAARDMDAVRQAAGDTTLTYLGYSYGTLLGAVYAQLFPTRVRAMVLDGAVDPTAGTVAAAQSQAQGFEHAFDQFAAWCRAHSCPAGPDARARLSGLLARARTRPATATDGRRATGGWILTAVAAALYSPDSWSTLGSALDELDTGDPARIFSLADGYAQRDRDGHYTNLFDVLDTVDCADETDTPSLSQARALQEQWRTRYPLFGAQAAVGLAACAVWPAEHDPYPTGRAAGAPPIVVLGTTGDPATPYGQTAKLAGMLGVGRVVTWQGQGHTAYPQTACIRRAVDTYLINLAVPAKGLTCPAQ